MNLYNSPSKSNTLIIAPSSPFFMRNNDHSLVETMSGSSSSDEISCIDRFLGDEAINILCDKIKSNHLDNKRRMVLRGNCVGVSGAKALSELLKYHHSLQFISLEWNQIGSAGVQYLAEALKRNEGLTHLDLRNNGIDNEGAIALSSALNDNNKLKVLDLRWNQIDDGGALSFKRAILERIPSLTLLYTGNRLTEPTNRTLDEWTAVDKQPHFEPLPVPPPTTNVQTYIFQNDLLQREIASMRQQSISLQAVCADVQRQLDSSSLRVTDLEQHISRDEYKFNQIGDALKQANSRIVVQTEEQKALCTQWERERADMRTEFASAMQIKVDEVRAVLQEKDAMRDRLSHLEEENARLKLQLLNLTQQHDSERASTDGELRLTLNRVNDLSISETKLKSEVSLLRANNSRLSEKQSVLVEELAGVTREHDRALRIETDRNAGDIERLRAEHKVAHDRASEKQARQARDIVDLQTLAAQVSSQHAKQVSEMETSNTNSLAAMRAEERQRGEQSLRDLKQRLELMTSARAELDQRSHGLILEIKSLREEHRCDMEQMQTQLADMENELQRLRGLNSSQKALLTAVEAEGKGRAMEVEDLRRQLRAAQEQSDGFNRELQIAFSERQVLQQRAEKADQHCASLVAGRVTEFASVSRQVVRAVERELESLRVDFKIRSEGLNIKE